MEECLSACNIIKINLNISPRHGDINIPGRSSVWLERGLWESQAGGSSPLAPTKFLNARKQRCAHINVSRASGENR